MILVILKLTALGSAAYGAAARVGNMANIKKTKGKDNRAKKRHGAAATASEERWDKVDQQAKEYGEFPLSILEETGCIPAFKD